MFFCDIEIMIELREAILLIARHFDYRGTKAVSTSFILTRWYHLTANIMHDNYNPGFKKNE